MATHRPLPTLARLQELLDYDPETGVLTWKVRRNQHALAGSVAGNITWRGYWEIKIDGRKYKAHRIAYYLGTGIDPGNCQIDHYPDPTRTNNRLANLRLAVDAADNCSTRADKPTRPFRVTSPEGEVTQCPSIGAVAVLMGLSRRSVRGYLSGERPAPRGWALTPCDEM